LANAAIAASRVGLDKLVDGRVALKVLASEFVHLLSDIQEFKLGLKNVLKNKESRQADAESLQAVPASNVEGSGDRSIRRRRGLVAFMCTDCGTTDNFGP